MPLWLKLRLGGPQFKRLPIVSVIPATQEILLAAQEPTGGAPET